MTLHNPVWLHADSYDAVDFRNSLSSLLSSTGGIVGSGDYAVSAPASGMSVNVAAGQIWVPGTQVANQGQYYMLNDGTISVTVPAADPTNPRIDLIVAQIVDTQYGGASNTGEVVDVSGTPAASPVAPSAPANSLVLAQVYVGAGVTSITSGNITDERTRLALRAPLVSTPAARMYNNSSSEVAANTNAQITGMVQDFVKGSMGIASNAITVPVAGVYLVTAQIVYQNGSDGTVPSGQYNCNVYQNGTQIRSNQVEVGATNSFATPAVNDLVNCAAGDVLTLWGYTSSSQNAYSYIGTTKTWLSAQLVSQT